MALPTGLSRSPLIRGCGRRPVLGTQEGTISTRPALAAVVGPEDRRAQQDLQAGEVAEAEAEVVRAAGVADQVVGAAAEVLEAAVVQAEELSPVAPRAPQLPNLQCHLRLVALEGLDAPSNGVPPLAHARLNGIRAAELSRKSRSLLW